MTLVQQPDLELPHLPLGYGPVDGGVTAGRAHPGKEGLPRIPPHREDWVPVVLASSLAPSSDSTRTLLHMGDGERNLVPFNRGEVSRPDLIGRGLSYAKRLKNRSTAEWHKVESGRPSEFRVLDGAADHWLRYDAIAVKGTCEVFAAADGELAAEVPGQLTCHSTGWIAATQPMEFRGSRLGWPTVTFSLNGDRMADLGVQLASSPQAAVSSPGTVIGVDDVANAIVALSVDTGDVRWTIPAPKDLQDLAVANYGDQAVLVLGTAAIGRSPGGLLAVDAISGAALDPIDGEFCVHAVQAHGEWVIANGCWSRHRRDQYGISGLGHGTAVVHGIRGSVRHEFSDHELLEARGSLLKGMRGSEIQAIDPTTGFVVGSRDVDGGFVELFDNWWIELVGGSHLLLRGQHAVNEGSEWHVPLEADLPDDMTVSVVSYRHASSGPYLIVELAFTIGERGRRQTHTWGVRLPTVG